MFWYWTISRYFSLYLRQHYSKILILFWLTLPTKLCFFSVIISSNSVQQRPSKKLTVAQLFMRSQSFCTTVFIRASSASYLEQNKTSSYEVLKRDKRDFWVPSNWYVSIPRIHFFDITEWVCFLLYLIHHSKLSKNMETDNLNYR